MENNFKRYNGIDIIKVIAIFFVPLLHFYLNYDFGKINMVDFSNLVEIMVRWLAFSCIGLFIMSSGYLMCKKTLNKKYYLKIFYFLLLYGIALLIQHTMKNHFGNNYILDYLTKFFQFGGYFWYVSFYICLYSLIPYMNLLVEKMEKKKFLIFLGTLIILTSLAITINSIPHLKTPKVFFLPGSFMVLWPAVYYYIGVYYNKFNPQINKKIYFLVLIITLTFISVLNFIYSKKGPAFFTGGGYGNLISVIITTCIFGIFYQIKFKYKYNNYLFKFLSSLTFETYLGLHMSDLITKKIMNRITNNGFVEYKYILIEVLLNFSIAFIFGLFIHYFAKIIMNIFNYKSFKKKN